MPKAQPQHAAEAQVAQPRLLGDEQGATSLEWALLLGAIAIPSYLIIMTLLRTLVGYYQMMTTLNSLPFP